MPKDLGKKFEAHFASDWQKCFPNTFLFRLHDQTSGFKTISKNPCDYLAFNNNILWMLECKETKENTFNFAKLTQYDLLKSYSNLVDVKTYCIIWFSKHDKIIAVEIPEITRLKELDFKSINVKMIRNLSYNIIDIPVEKKRIFLEADYTALIKK